MSLFPFVSRGRFEDMRDRARKAENRVDELTDQLTRLTRRRNGMPEEKRNGKKQKIPPMPKEFRDLVEGFESGANQRQLKRDARQRVASGEDWQQVTQELKQKMGG